MEPLTPTQRRELRALAHHKEPVVTIGHAGVTPPVLHEIDLALTKHELVKVRVLGDDRDAREAMLAQICEQVECAPVQHVGKVLVVWRPNPEIKEKAAAKAKAKAKPEKPSKPRKTGKRAPVDPVRERRRTSTPTTGKGRRGAARHAPAGEPAAETSAPPPAGAATRRRRTPR